MGNEDTFLNFASFIPCHLEANMTQIKARIRLLCPLTTAPKNT